MAPTTTVARLFLTSLPMLRVDQAWGLFQASVAAHDNHAAYYGVALTNDPAIPTTSGALPVSWPCRSRTSRPDPATRSTSRVSTPTVQPVTTSRTWPVRLVRTRSTAARAYLETIGSVGIGFAPDTVFATGTVLSNWSRLGAIRGGYTHNWNPYWNSSIYGAYAAVMYNDTAKALICGAGGAVPGRTWSGSDHLQPGLQHCAVWFHHPMDPGQEPDVLGRRDLDPSGSEVCG